AVGAPEWSGGCVPGYCGNACSLWVGCAVVAGAEEDAFGAGVVTLLERGAVVDLLGDQLIPQWRAEKPRLDRIDAWSRWRQDATPVPRGATVEHKRLLELSKAPWLNLVVTTIAQAMFVNGYRSPESSDMSTPWRTWKANDFDARQVAVHRASLAYGYAFTTVLPGSNDDGSRAV